MTPRFFHLVARRVEASIIVLEKIVGGRDLGEKEFSWNICVLDKGNGILTTPSDQRPQFKRGNGLVVRLWEPLAYKK